MLIHCLLDWLYPKASEFQGTWHGPSWAKLPYLQVQGAGGPPVRVSLGLSSLTPAYCPGTCRVVSPQS